MEFHWYFIQILFGFPIDLHLYFIQISTGYQIDFHWYLNWYIIEISNWNSKWIWNGFPLVFHWNFNWMSISISLKFLLSFNWISNGFSLGFHSNINWIEIWSWFSLDCHWYFNWISYGCPEVSLWNFNLYSIWILAGFPNKQINRQTNKKGVMGRYKTTNVIIPASAVMTWPGCYFPNFVHVSLILYIIIAGRLFLQSTHIYLRSISDILHFKLKCN